MNIRSSVSTEHCTSLTANFAVQQLVEVSLEWCRNDWCIKHRQTSWGYFSWHRKMIMAYRKGFFDKKAIEDFMKMLHSKCWTGRRKFHSRFSTLQPPQGAVAGPCDQLSFLGTDHRSPFSHILDPNYLNN